MAEVVLSSHEKLFHAVKRYGSVEHMIMSDSPVTDAARFPLFPHVHSTLVTRLDYGADPLE